jgi:formate C-acetyltransferase
MVESVFPGPTDRIVRLREAARARHVPGLRSDEGELLYLRGWLASRDAPSAIERRGRSRAYELRHATPVIDPDELLVGKPCYRRLSPEEQEELQSLRATVATAMPALGGQGSHMAIDYEKLLQRGILGLQEEIRERQDRLDPAISADLERQHFYAACADALAGLTDLAEAYAACALRSAETESNESRRAELRNIAGVCSRVPALPARNFREAVQSVHFVTFCLQGLYQLGRPDRYLIGYYTQDIQDGIMTGEEAQELIDCLCLLYNEYVPEGLAAGLMVGGRDADGDDVSNPLTRRFLESIPHTGLIYPGIGLCWSAKTPKELLRRAAELLADGHSHPAIFNDQVITAGLRGYGVEPAEACAYIHSTCVEITPIASSAVWVASPYINLVQPLLDIVNDAEPPSFNALKREYRDRLARVIREAATEQNRLQMERARHGGDPLVSCFVRDCLARGRDVDEGGARHNWIMPSFVGMANLIDSLAAIRELVYHRGELSLGELATVLEADFADHPALRASIDTQVPKYGNDDDEVDALAGEITRWIVEELRGYTTYRGDRFVPSLFCWVMHERLGSATQATPDGRPAGFPLGDGSGPAQGRERKGPTASVLSATKWDHRPFIGGIAVNMKFSRRMFEDQTVDKLAALLETFLQRGGFEIQINVVDADILRAAQAQPEAYRDLVVRVGGYSDYFVHLSPAMQEEVILRTEHDL